ncbi:ABC transporter ATP-binding protein [Streptomyces niveus]|uniref:ABC transporter ATP-binding protein n=1 Tax=Streptomyces niveus TaxID=193462 RepID=UPI0036D41718
MTELVFEDVNVAYGGGRAAHDVVRNVSLTVPSGRIMGLVGESGSGKSTLARAAVGLHKPRSGRILLDGTNVVNARGGNAALRRRIQMVFQDANTSLNPRMSIGAAIEEAILVRSGTARRDRVRRGDEVRRMLELVELDPRRSDDLPMQLSGGQRQRVAIARALAAKPQVLLADEITSALDVSVQGTVLNLLMQAHRQLGLTVLFISHNLAIVRQLCDEVAVMRAGEIVEAGIASKVIDNPKHPYTRALIGAVPRMGERLLGEGVRP